MLCFSPLSVSVLFWGEDESCFQLIFISFFLFIDFFPSLIESLSVSLHCLQLQPCVSVSVTVFEFLYLNLYLYLFVRHKILATLLTFSHADIDLFPSMSWIFCLKTKIFASQKRTSCEGDRTTKTIVTSTGWGRFFYFFFLSRIKLQECLGSTCFRSFLFCFSSYINKHNIKKIQKKAFFISH